MCMILNALYNKFKKYLNETAGNMIVKTTKQNKIIFNNKLKSDKKSIWYIV